MPIDSQKFSIQITVGSKSFSIVVNREDEFIYREAARMINQKLQQYSNSYLNKDKEDYLTMVLLDIAVKLVIEKNMDSQLEEMAKKIDEALDNPQQ